MESLSLDPLSSDGKSLYGRAFKRIAILSRGTILERQVKDFAAGFSPCPISGIFRS